VRLDQHAALELADFNMLFNATWNFVVACEVICKRMVVGLRGTIVGQAKAFLSSFHAKRLSLSAKYVEDETWMTVEVSSKIQILSDTIVNCAVEDQRSLRVDAEKEAHETTFSKFLKIEGRTYYVVGCTTMVLPLIADYLRVIVNLPLLTTDTVSRVVEFLKSFNSRTCQVVLGAGAMRSAGLKNITAKHLGGYTLNS
jgi:vacuolar protein sorting-associated protein 54